VEAKVVQGFDFGLNNHDLGVGLGWRFAGIV
jgi:hypothetical protein